MNRRWIPHLARLAGLLVLVFAGAAAAEPASPGVEVKFFLEPSVSLDTARQPSRDVLAAFQVAVAKREALLELLEQKRWLLEGDLLKTAPILERGKRTR